MILLRHKITKKEQYRLVTIWINIATTVNHKISQYKQATMRIDKMKLVTDNITIKLLKTFLICNSYLYSCKVCLIWLQQSQRNPNHNRRQLYNPGSGQLKYNLDAQQLCINKVVSNIPHNERDVVCAYEFFFICKLLKCIPLLYYTFL